MTGEMMTRHQSIAPHQPLNARMALPPRLARPRPMAPSRSRVRRTGGGAVVEDQTPIPEEQREYPEPVPRWVAERAGPLRTRRFVSASESARAPGEAEEAALTLPAAHGATIVGLHFIAEQLVTTSHLLALFAGLAARVIWLRKARRRRGAGDDAARDVTRVFFFLGDGTPRLGRARAPPTRLPRAPEGERVSASRAFLTRALPRSQARWSPRRARGRPAPRSSPPPRARSRAGWCPPPP